MFKSDCYNLTVAKEIVKIILLKDNKVLLQHRDSNPNITFPGFWSLFGGEIEKGETPLQAVKREIKEEIGIDLANPIFIAQQNREEGTTLVKDYIFRANIKNEQSEIQVMEGREAAYFDKLSIASLKVVPHYLKYILAELETK